MAKKNKRNIKALIAKRAELQSLAQKSTLTIPGAPKASVKPIEELTAIDTHQPTTVSAHHGKEIWRTLLATGVVAIVLTSVIVVDRQKPFLESFGAKLYDVLELGN